MTGRGYSWPPFTTGNQVAVKHGAFSSRVISPKAEVILAELAAAAPDWLEQVDQAALLAWAESEARVEVLRVWVSEHGLIDAKGKPTNAADLLLRAERQAADLRSRLGFDPLSRARLGRDVASARVDIARLWAEQAEEEEPK